MLKEKYTTTCKKDIKLIKRQNKDRSKLSEVINLLQSGTSLPPEYKDHALSGNKQGSRECHIEPDWLLIYTIDIKNNLLILERTGSHANLFESAEKLGSWTREMIRPENLIGPFNSIEELMAATWDAED